MSPFHNILVATDLGEPSRRAVDLAIELANTLGAKLTVLHVFEVPSYAYGAVGASTFDLLTPIASAAKLGLDELMVDVTRRVPAARSVLRQGLAWQQILGVAQDEHCDLIVVGTHGRKGLSHLVMGSVAAKVVRLSPVPVISARGGAEEAGPKEAKPAAAL